MENEANKAMSGGSNGLPNNDTHVGYGRNRGDGSDAQNQQPVDALQRYTDQSDSFVGKVTKGMMELIESNKEFGIPAESSLDGVSPEVYKRVLSENANTMFEKAPVQFKDALNAMMSKVDVPCMVGTSIYGGCYYTHERNSVFITREYFENNGSPYQEFWEVLLHEYSHAIDYNLSKEYGFRASSPISSFLALQSTGGLTLLEAAMKELGGDELYREYDELVKYDGASYEHENELKRLQDEKQDSYEIAEDIALNAICSKFGYNRAMVSEELSTMGFPNVDDVDFVLMFVDDDVKEGIGSYFKDEAFAKERERMQTFVDRYNETGFALIKKYNENKDKNFENAMNDSKEFGALNDIMSAVNGGKSNQVLGYGHDSEYYKYDDNKATEIFAEIGPVLAQNGKAAEWLKEKAPKLVAGYYELLGLALNKFKL